MEPTAKFAAISSHGGAVVVRVEGSLTGSALAELGALCAAAHAPASALTLDLAGLTSIDEPARRHLIALRAAGCRLERASLYLTHLLQEREQEREQEPETRP